MIIFTIFKHPKLHLSMKYLILTILLIGFLSTNSFGQVIDPAEIAKRKAENRANNKIDQGIDKGLDKVEGLFKKKNKKNKDDKSDDSDDAQEEQESNQNQNNKSDNKNAESKGNTPSFKTYSKFDFVSGEKVIAFDDFSTTSVGDFPLGWNTNASAEIVTLEGRPEKWFYMSSTGNFQPDYIKELPENFTLEFDVMTRYASSNILNYHFAMYASDNPRRDVSDEYLSNTQAAIKYQWGGCKSGAKFTVTEKGEIISENDNLSVEAFVCGNQDYSEAAFVRVSIWRQKNRLRIYANETKILDIPQAFNPAIKYNCFRLGSGYMNYSNGAENKDEFMVTNLRYAVGQPDTRNKLITEGKLVTRGITFDSGSDKIKAESYGTLKEIAQVLNENAGVKVKIIGHTDSDGDSASNLELSKKRAAAVKQTLASEFGVDASRLETDGKGASEPSEPNTTPQGKANNRRVEFIKL
jgi:outer membrane protein OmpA-like peptidoglycan-associated protein